MQYQEKNWKIEIKISIQFNSIKFISSKHNLHFENFILAFKVCPMWYNYLTDRLTIGSYKYAKIIKTS